jgi:hypothetical protein
MGRTRLWAVTIALTATVAGSAVGSAAMGDGKDDSHDTSGSHDSQVSPDGRDEGGHDKWKGGDKRDREFDVRARLTGYEEDPLTISTPGSGRFSAHVDERAKEIKFKLSYEDLEGDVKQAHIHFGGRHQSGGIIVFLCSNLQDKNSHDGVQKCPEAPATIEGTIKPEDVIGPEEQGIKPGEFDELVDAIEAGVTYANVHTSKYPNGEIRGQIESDDDKDRDKKGDDRDRDESDRSRDNEDHDRDGSDRSRDNDGQRRDHDDRTHDYDDEPVASGRL